MVKPQETIFYVYFPYMYFHHSLKKFRPQQNFGSKNDEMNIIVKAHKRKRCNM